MQRRSHMPTLVLAEDLGDVSARDRPSDGHLSWFSGVLAPKGPEPVAAAQTPVPHTGRSRAS